MALVGAVGGGLVVLAGIAVAWGRVRQTLDYHDEASKETLILVRELQERMSVVETTSEDHDSRLDRLEAPLFRNRN